MFLKSGRRRRSEEAAPTEATVAVAGTGATGTATGATPGEAVEGAVEGAIEAAAAKPPPARSPTSIPAPPLPAPVAAAYDAGKTVVLLVVHDGGIDDALVDAALRSGWRRSRTSRSSSSRPSRSPATRRSRSALDVSQVPALVVMRPKRLSDGIPQATVDYGFQTAAEHRPGGARRRLQGPRSAPTTRTEPAMSSTTTQYPSHLRPVPDSGGSAAPALPSPSRRARPGLTPPLQRGHSRGFITDVLVELGYAAAETVAGGDRGGAHRRPPPEALLLEQGAINDDQLSRATAERYGLDHVDLAVYHVDVAAAALFPVTMARRYKAVPVGYVDQQTLLVAAADPANVLAVDDIQIATGLDCRIAVAAEDDVEALLARLGTLQSAAADAIIEERATRPKRRTRRSPRSATMQASAEDAPVIKLVYSILAQAVGEGASDIHLEPEEGELRIRFRVDGVLKEAAHVPKRMIGAVISRLKIMSELDIAEKRVPQDGRVSVAVEERRIDLRVTTLPTQRGEGATIRILDESNAQRTLDDLGMDGSARARFEDAFRQAYGAVLVTGPTGSGKSTTLYAALGRAERDREEDHHDRGPGRVPDRRRQPDERQPQGGARLRHRPALDPARRPRHRDGRRDPRRGDGADRDRGGADRPHDADHAAHQRRPGRDRPPQRDGDRDLPHRLGGRLRRRPAAGPQALPELQAAHGDPGRGAGRGRGQGRRRGRGLRAGRLRRAATTAATAAGSGSTR